MIWNEAERKFVPVEEPYSAYELGKMKDVTEELYGIGGIEGEALPWGALAEKRKNLFKSRGLK